MSSHSSRAFLNSCIKVPIDPCNNCPAPIYNRPKIYLGRLSKDRSKLGAVVTPLEKVKNLDEEEGQAKTESDGACPNAGIRSLAKFYDSIPDYCEVNHLPEAEFYSTLESLRTTSRELRTQSTILEPRITSSSTTSSLSAYLGLSKVKTKKKRQGSSKSGTNRKKSSQRKAIITPPLCDIPHSNIVANTTRSITDDYTKCLHGLSKLNKFKQDFAAEVDDFRRTLQNYELEFKHPISDKASECPTLGCSTSKDLISKQLTNVMTMGSGGPTMEQLKAKQSSKVSKSNVRPISKSILRESLRKCYSVNDLDSCSSDILISPLKSEETLLTRVRHTEFSKYFPPKNSNKTPMIVATSPTTPSKRSSSATYRSSERSNKKGEAMEKPPFTVFQEASPKHDATLPVHPVARPNLAATLRAEVARRKIKELKNNCTYHDTTPQFDWEVRKTSAWKSLTMNEPHKAILSIRLATRKSEQALQQRQYELQQGLMRQRVKSAPLLLEGETFWGQNVGKLTHRCQREGMRHSCDSKQRRQQKKNTCQSSRCVTSTSCHTAECNTGDHEIAKLKQLRKIYGTSGKSCSSRNSQRCSNEKLSRNPVQEQPDSGDDLCSIDRAFL